MLNYEGDVYPLDARQTVLTVYIVSKYAELAGFYGINGFLCRSGLGDAAAVPLAYGTAENPQHHEKTPRRGDEGSCFRMPVDSKTTSRFRPSGCSIRPSL